MARQLLDELDDVEHREVEADDHAADDHTHQADQHRLDQRRQRVDGRGDLLVVEVGDLVEHLVERAGLLTDRDHLHDHRREHLVLLERAGQRVAALDRLCVSRTAVETTSLPDVSATMSSASRMPTPERVSAASVREKRASAALRVEQRRTPARAA